MKTNNAAGYPYRSLKNPVGKLYVSSNGIDSLTAADGSFYAPFATPSFAMAQATDGYVIEQLDSITDTVLAMKPNVPLISVNGATLTLDNLTLTGAWSAVASSLLISGLNLTLTNPIDFDLSGAMLANRYYLKLANLILRVGAGNLDGLNLIGLTNAFNSQAFFALENVQAALEDQTGSLCDIVANKGAQVSIKNCRLGAVRVRCDQSSASTNVRVDAASFFQGNSSNESMVGYSAADTFESANVVIKIFDTAQNNPPQLITLSQAPSNGNQLSLDQDPKSYRAPVATGTGVAGVDYFIDQQPNSDSIALSLGGSNSTLNWGGPQNFEFPSNPIQNVPNVTMGFAGIDARMGRVANLLWIANDGNDLNSGSPSSPFLTIAGMYAAITDASINKQYIVFDVRGNAAEGDIELKPFIQIFGFGTDLTVGNITLSVDWDTLTTDASGAFGYYESLTSNSQVFLDFRNAASALGRKYQFYLTGNKSKFDASVCKVYGLWNGGAAIAEVYIDDCNAADISGGRDTWIEFDYGISAFVSDSMLAQIKVYNQSADATITKVRSKNNTIYGRASTGAGISMFQPLNNAGATIEIDMDASPNLAATTKLDINSDNAVDSGTMTITMDAISYAAPTNTGSGVQGVNYFVKSSTNVSSINTSINSEAFTPVNYTPVQDAAIDYENPISHYKGIDTKLGEISPASLLPPPNYLYGFPVKNGAAGQLSIQSGTWMSAMSYLNTSAIVPINETLILDSSISGPGGIDAGTVAVNTLYKIFIIWDSTGVEDNNVIMSLSDSPDVGPDYDQYRMVATWKTKLASTDFVEKIQSGLGTQRCYDYTGLPAEMALYTGNDIVLTEVDLLPFAAPTTRSGELSYILNPSVAAGSFSVTPHANSNLNRGALVTATGATSQCIPFVCDPTTVSIDIVVDAVTTNLTLTLARWDEQL